MGSMGIRELVIILVVVLLVFGTRKIASIGADLGRAVRGFKQAMSEGEQEDNTAPPQWGGKEFLEVRKAEAVATIPERAAETGTRA
jgi:sec-independent protein translocase protein TatA